MNNSIDIQKSVEELTVLLVKDIMEYLENNNIDSGHDVMCVLTSTITSTMVSTMMHMRQFMMAEFQCIIDRDVEAFRTAMYTIFNKPETLQ